MSEEDTALRIELEQLRSENFALGAELSRLRAALLGPLSWVRNRWRAVASRQTQVKHLR